MTKPIEEPVPYRTSCQFEGSPEAKLLLLGEAPSGEEIRRNQPFVGPAGEVLDDCLIGAGIERSECMIANVWGDRVDKLENGNIVTHDQHELLWTPGGGFTNQGWTLSLRCRQEIEASKANVIVPLGLTALSLVAPELRTGRQKWTGLISKWRGSVMQESVWGRKYVATFHPANVVWGATENRHVIAGDLRRAHEESAQPELIRRKRQMVTDPSIGTVLNWLASCRKAGRIWFDVELFNGQLSAFNFTCEEYWGMCIPFLMGPGQHRWTESSELMIMEAIADLLEDPSIDKGNQNILFDMWAMLWTYGIHVRGRIDDPMVLHHIVFPDLPKSLAFQCSWLTDVPFYKDDVGMPLWRTPWENLQAFWEYGCRDAFVPLECWRKLSAEYLRPGSPYERTYRETMEMADPLAMMMLHGITVDAAGMQRERDTQLAKQTEALAQCREAGLENPLSSKQTMEFFGLTKAADKFALLKIIKDAGPKAEIAKACLTVRRAGKQISNYFEMPLVAGRMMTSYNYRGTNTGRLSSSGSVLGGGANEQNLTSEFTRWLVPDGWMEPDEVG